MRICSLPAERARVLCCAVLCVRRRPNPTAGPGGRPRARAPYLFPLLSLVFPRLFLPPTSQPTPPARHGRQRARASSRRPQRRRPSVRCRRRRPAQAKALQPRRPLADRVLGCLHLDVELHVLERVRRDYCRDSARPHLVVVPRIQPVELARHSLPLVGLLLHAHLWPPLQHPRQADVDAHRARLFQHRQCALRRRAQHGSAHRRARHCGYRWWWSDVCGKHHHERSRADLAPRYLPGLRQHPFRSRLWVWRANRRPHLGPAQLALRLLPPDPVPRRQRTGHLLQSALHDAGGFGHDDADQAADGARKAQADRLPWLLPARRVCRLRPACRLAQDFVDRPRRVRVDRPGHPRPVRWQRRPLCCLPLRRDQGCGRAGPAGRAAHAAHAHCRCGEQLPHLHHDVCLPLLGPALLHGVPARDGGRRRRPPRSQLDRRRRRVPRVGLHRPPHRSLLLAHDRCRHLRHHLGRHARAVERRYPRVASLARLCSAGPVDGRRHDAHDRCAHCRYRPRACRGCHVPVVRVPHDRPGPRRLALGRAPPVGPPARARQAHHRARRGRHHHAHPPVVGVDRDAAGRYARSRSPQLPARAARRLCVLRRRRCALRHCELGHPRDRPRCAPQGRRDCGRGRGVGWSGRGGPPEQIAARETYILSPFVEFCIDLRRGLASAKRYGRFEPRQS